MKIFYSSLLIIIILTTPLQSEKYRVFFTDKGNQVLEYNNDLYNSILDNLDKKAIQRRKINLESDTILSFRDIPIYQNYLDSLENVGIEIISQLTWYNYIVIDSDSLVASELLDYPFVSDVQQVIKNYKDETNTLQINNCDEFDYNLSENHIKMLNVDKLHQYGITGQGARLGFLDTGFDWLRHNAIKNTNVIKTYDFIYRDTIVSNQKVDVQSQINHGTIVMSTVTAYDNGRYIGVAPNVEVYLAKTEDMKSETYYELDLFAEAIIWMENNGVDIINASLGYRSLDTFSIPFSDLDGNTTIAAKAVNDASELGMICVIAAGNNGDRAETISSPTDADSSVSVGALTPNGIDLVGFSSNGPNASGVMKPNLVAQGSQIFAVSTANDSSYAPTAGTSISSPLIAGSFALLMSIHPTVKSSTLKSWMYQSADRFNNPDNRFGYGLPNVFESAKSSSKVITYPNIVVSEEFTRLYFYIFPDEDLINYTIEIMLSENTIKNFPLRKTNIEKQYIVDLPNMYFLNNKLDIRVTISDVLQDFYFPDKNSYFTVTNESDLIQCGVIKDELFTDSLEIIQSDLLIVPNIIYNDFKTDIILKLFDYESITISVFDITGKEMFKTITDFGPGNFKRNISLNNLNSGTYFILVKTDNNVLREKIIFLK